MTTFGTWSISKNAVGDLDQLRDSSVETWGSDQAYDYLSQLISDIDRVALKPASRRACDDIRPGLFRVKSGFHVIFYRQVESGSIRVVRVLHERMDFGSRLY